MRKKTRPAHNVRKTITPTVIPAMLAVESFGGGLLADTRSACELTVGGETKVEEASLGTGSPGAS